MFRFDRAIFSILKMENNPRGLNLTNRVHEEVIRTLIRMCELVHRLNETETYFSPNVDVFSLFHRSNAISSRNTRR